MAGHSKWSNIKHRKAAQDAKRGRIFTQLIRELTSAARLGGGAVTDNPRLRLAVDKALAANMTRSTIDRAIMRGCGVSGGEDLKEFIYEGYGAGGAAVLVEAFTENRNRTVAEVRHAFTANNGRLGTEGSVAYLFSKQGRVLLQATDEEAVMDVAEQGSADDVEPQERGFVLSCAPERLGELLDCAEQVGLPVLSSGVEQQPSIWVELDEEEEVQLSELLGALGELDDVQEVHCNVRLRDQDEVEEA